MKNHMRKPEFIILSAELSSLTGGENTFRTRNLVACLVDLGVKYTPVTGCYEGVEEISFMVMTPDESTFEAVRDLGLKSFNQDSILFRDYTGEAALYYGNGDYQPLGTFKQVTKECAFFQDAYTKVNGAYWIVA